LPGSDIVKDMETIRFANQLGVDFAQFYSATPYLGSEFYSMAQNNNWIANGKKNYDVQKDAVISYPHYTQKQIALMRTLAYKKFYLNAKRIKTLLSYNGFITNPFNFMRTLKGVLKFLKWSGMR
jgi:radical SAM superfamily enzyme YgiQ (UPF0313 family)